MAGFWSGREDFEPLLPRTVILAESLQVAETNSLLNSLLAGFPVRTAPAKAL